MTANRKRSHKVNKKFNIKLFITFLILIIIVACILYNIIALFISPSDTFIIDKGKISETEETIGYIIREETVFEGQNYKNGISQIKNEGEKIAKGEHIYRYYSKNEEELIKKIEDLDVQIQEAMEETNNIYSSDITAIEKNIDTQLKNLSNVNKISDIQEIKRNIDNLLTKKAKMIGDLSPSGSYIKKLISQRSEYETKLNSGSEYIDATTSGIVSYRIDGLEEKFKVKDIKEFTKKDFEDINIKVGQIVSTSNEKAKIVNNYYCYIACILNSEPAKDLKEKDNIKIALSSGNEINATVEYIKEDGNDRIVILRIINEVENLINYRKISFSIIWWSASGLKVPNTSILTDGDKKYIVRKRAGYSDKILVKVLKESKKYSIIDNYTSIELKEIGYTTEEIKNHKNISLYDEILLNPTK